jgi:hypothetical protein
VKKSNAAFFEIGALFNISKQRKGATFERFAAFQRRNEWKRFNPKAKRERQAQKGEVSTARDVEKRVATLDDASVSTFKVFSSKCS